MAHYLRAKRNMVVAPKVSGQGGDSDEMCRNTN